VIPGAGDGVVGGVAGAGEHGWGRLGDGGRAG
jgi:hypothetical protein